MIDLHTHILPGVDDGVETDDEAVEFARCAVADGVRVIVATPHCRDGFHLNDRRSVLDGVARLRERLDREGVGVEDRAGGRGAPVPGPRGAGAGRARPDARGQRSHAAARAVAERSTRSSWRTSCSSCVWPGSTPCSPIRSGSASSRTTWPRYERVVRLGAYGQITTGSILGTFGRTARDFSTELLRKGLVHVVASDAHNVRGRPPTLTAAVAAAERLVGGRRARAMVQEAPRCAPRRSRARAAAGRASCSRPCRAVRLAAAAPCARRSGDVFLTPVRGQDNGSSLPLSCPLNRGQENVPGNRTEPMSTCRRVAERSASAVLAIALVVGAAWVDVSAKKKPKQAEISLSEQVQLAQSLMDAGRVGRLARRDERDPAPRAGQRAAPRHDGQAHVPGRAVRRGREVVSQGARARPVPDRRAQLPRRDPDAARSLYRGRGGVQDARSRTRPTRPPSWCT